MAIYWPLCSDCLDIKS